MSVKTVSLNLSPLVTIPLTVLVAMFDKDGAGLGLALWPDTPAYVLTVSTLFGNLLWILGLMFGIYAAVVVLVVSEADTKQMAQWKAAMKDKARGWKVILPILGFGSAIFLIASGYWFTGSCWLAAVFVSGWFRRTVMKTS